MSNHRRWASVPPIDSNPVASPTFNTIIAAKKAELSTATPPWDTSTGDMVKVTTPTVKAKRDITAELAKLAGRKASAKEKATAPKSVKIKEVIKAKAPAVAAKAKPKKTTPIKPAKTVKAPVAKKAVAPKTAKKKA